MGWVKGLEPSTLGTTIRCSNQLSYTHHIKFAADGNGTPGGIRTPGLLLRRQLLYPAELLAHINSDKPHNVNIFFQIFLKNFFSAKFAKNIKRADGHAIL